MYCTWEHPKLFDRVTQFAILSLYPICIVPGHCDDGLPEHLRHGVPQLSAGEVPVVVLVQRAERRQVDARRAIAKGAVDGLMT